MKKVLIIGSPGAGKSTFGRKLAVVTGLPLYYLDMIWHKADRTTVTAEEFDMRLHEIMSTSQWIIDGNYKRTLPLRLKQADTVFLLDLPLDVCIEGATRRLGSYRPDMPWHDKELDEGFRQWIIDYPVDQLPVIYAQLRSFKGELHVFHSHEEADSFIATLRDGLH